MRLNSLALLTARVATTASHKNGSPWRAKVRKSVNAEYRVILTRSTLSSVRGGSGMADESVCARCKVTSSLMWEKNKEGEVLCLECHSSTRHESPSSTVSTRAEPPSTSTVAHSNEIPTSGAAAVYRHV